MTARGRAGSGGATLSLVVFDVARWDRKARASRFTVRVKGPLTKRQADTASWKPMTLTFVRGTVLGAADFSEFESPDQRYLIRGEEDFVPIPREQWASRRLGEIVDGILYTGPDKTSSGIWPQLCADPGYVKMRVDRIALIGLPPAQADAVERVCNLK